MSEPVESALDLLGELAQTRDINFDVELAANAAPHVGADFAFDVALQNGPEQIGAEPPTVAAPQPLFEDADIEIIDVGADLAFNAEVIESMAPPPVDAATDVMFEAELDDPEPTPEALGAAAADEVAESVVGSDIAFEGELQVAADEAEPADLDAVVATVVDSQPPAPLIGSDIAFEAELASIPTLGDAINNAVSAFRKEAETRAAASVPLLTAEHLPQKARDWQIDFGPVWGPAGEQTTITMSPQCLFKGHKIIATDTYDTPGTGTRIMKVLIGNKVQRPASGESSTLTKFFAANALENGLKWETCQDTQSIAVTVSFVQSCTFDMSVFGKAVDV